MPVRNFFLGALAAATLGAGAHAAVFTQPSSGSTPYSITSGNQTVTFSSATPGAFATQSTTGLLSFPVGLVDQNFFPGDSLTIAFSAPFSGALSIPFAILDSGTTTDTLRAVTNAGVTTNFAATPDSLALAEPEGQLSLVANGLTSLTLTALDNSGNVLGLAIGNVSVPEPVSMALLGTGLLGFAASRRRSA